MLFARNAALTSKGAKKNTAAVRRFLGAIGTPSRDLPVPDPPRAYGSASHRPETTLTASIGDARRGINTLFYPRSIALVSAPENIERIYGRLLYYPRRHGYATPIYQSTLSETRSRA